jgi:hypothetical protein
MIKIPQPSMVLNAPDFPARCTMRVTYDVDPQEAPDIYLRQVRQAAMRQPGGRLRYLIINCHGIYRSLTGGPGDRPSGGYGLSLGKGLFTHNAEVFGLLRSGGPGSAPLVEKIFITSCGASAVSPQNGMGDGDGERMCKKIAKHSGAMVFGADIIQVFGIDAFGQLPPYQIKSFNGTVKAFDSSERQVAKFEYPKAFLQGAFFGPN